jgi:hypothetical protein
MTPTTYGRDFAYCLKSHGGVRGFNASLWRFLLRCTLFCHSVATFLTSVSSYEGGCGFEGYIKRYQKLFHFLFYRFIFLDTFNSVGMNNSTGHLSAFSYRLEFYHKEIVYVIVTGEHIIILRDTILFTLHFGFGSVWKWLL